MFVLFSIIFFFGFPKSLTAQFFDIDNLKIRKSFDSQEGASKPANFICYISEKDEKEYYMLNLAIGCALKLVDPE